MADVFSIRPQASDVAGENDGTRVVGEWLEEEEDWAKQQGVRMTPFAGDDAHRANIEPILDGEDSNIVYYGHAAREGDRLCWRTTDETLIGMQDVVRLSGKVLYTFACHSAKQLGPQVVAHGAPGTAYFGYKIRIRLYPDIAEHLKLAASAGLRTLLAPTDEHRERVFEAVESAVRKTYWDVETELKRKAREADNPDDDAVFRSEALLVGLHRAGFWAGWKPSGGNADEGASEGVRSESGAGNGR